MASTSSVPAGCGIYSYGFMLPSPVPATCNPDHSISPGIKWSASTRAILYVAADQLRNRGYNLTVNSPLDGFNWKVWYYYIKNNVCIDPRTLLACMMCDGDPTDPAQQSDTWRASHKLFADPKNHVVGSFNSNNRVALRVTPSAYQTGCTPFKTYVLPYGTGCTEKFGYVTSACKSSLVANGIYIKCGY